MRQIHQLLNYMIIYKEIILHKTIIKINIWVIKKQKNKIL